MMPYFFFKELVREISPNISLLFMEEIIKEIDSNLYNRITDLTNYGNLEDEIEKKESLDKNTELYENTKVFIENILKKIKQTNDNIEKEMAELFEKNNSKELLNYCKKNVEFHRYSFLSMYNELVDLDITSNTSSYKKTQKRSRTKSLPTSNKRNTIRNISKSIKRYNSI
jgi:S-adenosylmethionine hydrolase